MKKELTREYVLQEKGCYSIEQASNLSFMKKDKFNVNAVVKSEIPLKDKFWFVIKKCDLTTRQKQDIAIGVAEIVLNIYESKYPDNKAPREAIQAAKDFLNGIITIEVLRQKRSVAYAAAAAAYAAAAYAAAYAANAAAYAADAADAAAYAADAAADAADAAAYAKKGLFKKNYTNILLKFLLTFIKDN